MSGSALLGTVSDGARLSRIRADTRGKSALQDHPPNECASLINEELLFVTVGKLSIGFPLGRSCVAGSDDNKVYSINASNGTTNWTSLVLQGPIDAAPAIANSLGLVFVGTGGGLTSCIPNCPVCYNGQSPVGWVYALNASNGGIYSGWSTNPVMTCGSASPTLDTNGNLFVAGAGGMVYSLGPTSWPVQTGGPVLSSPALGQ